MSYLKPAKLPKHFTVMYQQAVSKSFGHEEYLHHKPFWRSKDMLLEAINKLVSRVDLFVLVPVQ